MLTHAHTQQDTAEAGGLMTGPAQVVDLDARDVDRARRGDLTAAERLYRRHQRRVWNMARVMLGGGARGEADAEDICQEVFLRALGRLEQFRGEARFGTWLHRITVNQVRNHQARQRVRSVEEGRDDPELGSPVSPGRRPRPELKAALAGAMEQLSERQREVLCCHDVLGMSHLEIAYVLGCAEGTSKVQLHRARMRVRALLTADRP